MNRILFYFFCCIVAIFIVSCNHSDNTKDDDTPTANLSTPTDTAQSCMKVPSRFGIDTDTASIQYSGNTPIEGMTNCSGYRVARRMKSSPDTGLEHTGFRCVKDQDWKSTCVYILAIIPALTKDY